jgi:hypothetical protein
MRTHVDLGEVARVVDWISGKIGREGSRVGKTVLARGGERFIWTILK